MNLVSNWRHLWKSACVLLALIGAAIPTILDWLSANFQTIAPIIPVMTPDQKTHFYQVILCLVPLARAWAQRSVNPPKPGEIP